MLVRSLDILLWGNPWPLRVKDYELREILTKHGTLVEEALCYHVEEGRLDDDCCLAIVISKPTLRDMRTSIAQWLLGVIEVGSEAKDYKRDAMRALIIHADHGESYDQLVRSGNLCYLRDDEQTNGLSVVDKVRGRVVVGGSGKGISTPLLRRLLDEFLNGVLNDINTLLQQKQEAHEQ